MRTKDRHKMVSYFFAVPKAQFITPERRFNLFAQRQLAGNVTDKNNNAWHLYGKPDEMIASGFREPEAPFFCFHEYK